MSTRVESDPPPAVKSKSPLPVQRKRHKSPELSETHRRLPCFLTLGAPEEASRWGRFDLAPEQQGRAWCVFVRG